MINVLLKSLASLFDGFFIKIILITTIITIAIFSSFIASIGFYVDSLVEDSNWLTQRLATLAGSGTATVLSYFLFPITFPIISSLFLNKICTHMEKEHYPLTKPLNILSMSEALFSSLKFVTLAVTLNLLCLVLYLIPVIGFLIYFLLNSYLFGREYFEMISHRYNDPKETKILRKKHRFKVLFIGLMITFMFILPIVNLLAPIMATVLAVHFYHTKAKIAITAPNEKSVLTEDSNIRPEDKDMLQ